MPLRNLLATHMEWKEKLLSGNQVLQPARLLVVERMSTRRSSLSLDFWKSCREFLWLTGTQTDQNFLFKSARSLKVISQLMLKSRQIIQ
jgi:hypothetical protein